MGKLPDKKNGRDVYWFGLTSDGKNAFDYATFEDFSTAKVFDGKSLITAASIIITLTCVTMVTYLFFSDKSKGYIATFSTPMTYVPAGTCAAALVFFLLKVNEKAVGYIGMWKVLNDFYVILGGLIYHSVDYSPWKTWVIHELMEAAFHFVILSITKRWG